MKLEFENYIVNTEPKLSLEKRYWVFIHKLNPSIVSLVQQYSTTYGNKVTGEKKFVEFIKNNGLLKDKYIVSKQFTKDYTEISNRAQTGMKLSKKGNINIGND